MSISINIRWDGDEANIKYSDEFEKAYSILKADMLSDAIYELNELYELIIEQGLVEQAQ